MAGAVQNAVIALNLTGEGQVSTASARWPRSGTWTTWIGAPILKFPEACMVASVAA